MMDIVDKLSHEELAEIEALKLLKDEDIVFDDDCPEMTPTMEKSFRCAVAQRNRAKKIAN